MFGRATIRLGIGPHSSFVIFYYQYYTYIVLLHLIKCIFGIFACLLF